MRDRVAHGRVLAAAATSGATDQSGGERGAAGEGHHPHDDRSPWRPGSTRSRRPLRAPGAVALGPRCRPLVIARLSRSQQSRGNPCSIWSSSTATACWWTASGSPCRSTSSCSSGSGWPLTEAEVIERFVGRSHEYFVGEIEAAIGRPLDPDWEDEFLALYRDAFEAELAPVDGVVDALDRIAAPTCVASSSTPRATALHARPDRPARALRGPDLQRRRRPERQAGTRPVPARRRDARRRSGALRRGRGQRFRPPGRSCGGNGGLRLRRRPHAAASAWPGPRPPCSPTCASCRTCSARPDRPKRLGRPQAAQGHWSSWRYVRLPDRRARPPRPGAGGRVQSRRAGRWITGVTQTCARGTAGPGRRSRG